MIKLIKSTFFNEDDTKNKLCNFIKDAKTLSMSEQCALFEKKFAEKQGSDFAVFVNSGSSANLVLIQALLNTGRLRKGDLVAVSALTWATNIMPIIQLGLNPVLVDCELETLNVSPAKFLEVLIKYPKIKALFITHTLGLSDNIKEIAEICIQKNIILLEDTCEALGSSLQGKKLGSFGLASTFSFFVGHHLSTIEGGMVCTNDEELYHALIVSRAHGWDRNLHPKKQDELRKQHSVDDFFAKYTFYDLGYNIRPTEINGFLGVDQIGYWDEIVSSRENNFFFLNEAIKNNPNLLGVKTDHMDIVSSFAVPVIVKDANKVSEYKKIFIDSNVEIRPMIAGNMVNQPFLKKYVDNPGFHKNADFIHNHSFYFGNNPELTSSELELLKNILSS